MASEIIDVLSANVTTFTVDPAAQDVALGGAPIRLAKANGDELFASVDNVTLLAMGINLPFQYCVGEGLVSVFLEWVDQDELEPAVPIYFGFLPVVNGVFSFGPNGLYTQNPERTNWPTKQSIIRMGVGSGRVSMIYNPPNITNGTVLEARGWIQARHLLPME